MTLMLLVAACSSTKSAEALWNTPQSKPDFIAKYNNIPMTAQGTAILQPMICVEFNEAAVVEKGDTPTAIESDIKSTTTIELDGEKLSSDKVLFYSPYSDSLITKYTNNGDHLGFYVNGFTTCFSVSAILKGFHLSKLSFSRSSGKAYSFSWAFKVTQPDFK